jgi:hypothetical protein
VIAFFFTFKLTIFGKITKIIFKNCTSMFLATDPDARVRFPALPDEKKRIVGLERGPLSLVSTTEELLDRKIAAPV